MYCYFDLKFFDCSIYMSNHTNRDTYYKNFLINRHVGGKNPPLLQPINQYIQDQQKVLKDQILIQTIYMQIGEEMVLEI